MRDPTSRREFVRATLVAGTAVFLPAWLAGCNDDPLPLAPAQRIDTRTPAGQLNALYAMEQLSADFLERARVAPPAGMRRIERSLLGAMVLHEAAHQAQLAEMIGGARVSAALTFRFSSIDMTNADAVLATAQRLKDTLAAGYLSAVAAHGGTAREILAKMASVEQRHAAAVRDLVDERTGATGTRFAADVVDAQAPMRAPGEVLAEFRDFFLNPLEVA